MSELIMVVPSRGRPQAVKQLIETFKATCTGETELWIAVDDDDETLPQYQDVVNTCPDFPVRLHVGPRLRIGGTLNVVVPQAAELADAVGFMGDDHRPRTIGWDADYITTLRRMRTGVVYGDDLIQGKAMPTQCAMTSNIVKATGHFVPDGMLHLYLDNAWKAIGEATAIRYRPRVVVEHMHPVAGKAEWDEGYLLNNAQEVNDGDKAVYESWKANILPSWVEQIRAYK